MTGPRLFARYAYPPNKLGYCGPVDSASTLVGPHATDEELRALARGFHGAWPYLVVLAELAGVADPLDRAVVEAYWLGGGLADKVDHREFGAALLARIGPRAGHYWAHLTDELLDEAAPNHCFHVFGVYPWSRLLAAGPEPAPLHVLDSCRIGWGRVESADGETAEVRTRPLVFEDGRLAVGAPVRRRYTVALGGALGPGERVALHWEWVTDRLTEEQTARLRHATTVQLEATNRRLAAELTR